MYGHHLGRIEFTEPESHPEHAAKRLVDLTFGEQTLGNRAREVSDVRRVVEIAADQDSSGRRFFERRVLVMPGDQALDRAAVGHDEALEFPFVAQHAS